MATEVLCPICGATYNIAEDQLGKKLRCKKCEHAFFAGRKERSSADDEEDQEEGIQTEPRRRPPRAARRGDRSEDKDDGGKKKTPSVEEQAKARIEEPGMPVMTFVLAGVGVAVVLLCCGGGGLFWYRMSQSNNAVANNPNNPGGAGQGALPGFPLNNFPGINNPAPAPPPPGIANLDEALKALADANPGQRRAGADWLAQAPVNEGKRAQVAKEIDKLNGDANGDVRAAAVKATGTWGTADNVPRLVQIVRTRDGAALDHAIPALGKLKDPRGAEVVAEFLPDFFKHQMAADALQAMGKAAEPEVLKYYFHPDGRAREHAERLLRSYATAESVILDQVLTELKTGDDGKRRQALDWLVRNRVDDKKRPEVSRLLNGALQSGNGDVRNTAVNAAKVWGTAENAGPLAEIMGDFFVGRHAVDALKAIGPGAEPEVVKHYFNPALDGRARTHAEELLRHFGTKEMVKVTQAVAELRGGDAGRRKMAAEYLIKTPVIEEHRVAVAKAIEPMLDDSDGGMRSLGFRMAKTWGNKDNVPALVKQLADTHLFAKDLRHQAMEALAALKDERGVWPVALRVGDFFDNGVAIKSLVDMGPVAATELAKHIDEPDPLARDRAWTLLRDLGTPASVDLAALRTAAGKEKDPQVKAKANQAIKAIAARS
jgi:predicted Zn finger-like uncharacterized protein